MSLLRQLWISVIVVMAVVLIGTFIVSVSTARDTFEQQLVAQGNDGAVSLALTMSQQPKDRATAELLVSALFDGGHYGLVRYTDTAGHVVVQRTQMALPDHVPVWFLHLVPLRARPGQAQVSDGWRQAGQVTITAATQYAYQSLWQGTLRMGSLLLAIAFVWALVVTGLLRWIQRPLTAMASQADAIGEGRFLTVDEPHVKELRSMARAINRMSERVRGMFMEQAARIETLREEASRDTVTGLYNRGFFMGALRALLTDNGAPDTGSLVVVRVADLQGLNQRVGRARTDAFLRNVAAALAASIGAVPDAILARVNGSDCFCVMPLITPALAQSMARKAIARIEAGDDTDNPGSIRLHSAVTGYGRGEAVSALLARVDIALMQSEAGAAGVVEAQLDALTPMGEQSWAMLLRDALAMGRLTLAFSPVMDAAGSAIHQHARLVLDDPARGGWTPEHFMPAALRAGLMPAFNLEAVRLAVLALRSSGQFVAVGLSSRSLQDPAFLPALERQLKDAGDVVGRLSLELSERGLDDELTGVEALSEIVARHGATLGLRDFASRMIVLQKLYALNLGYIKIDGNFLADLETSAEQQRLVKAIVDVAMGLGIDVYVEHVQSEAVGKRLQALGVRAAILNRDAQ